jgi:arsenate reductase-like glutaredoxin family protein
MMRAMSDEVCLYFNPACSNCRSARGLLEEKGVPVGIVEYLEERTPSSRVRRSASPSCSP